VKGEVVAAFVVLRPGEACTEEDAAAYCRERMAAYNVPREVRFVVAVAKSPTGKILKRALREEG
jgi:long-chain acyl-CoA synthetase